MERIAIRPAGIVRAQVDGKIFTAMHLVHKAPTVSIVFKSARYSLNVNCQIR